MCVSKDKEWFIDLELPPVTSKFNGIISIDNSIWLIPYGIWDDFNIVVQLKDFKPIYHKINMPGKGQFYNIASDGKTAFSFPLGYEDTGYGLFIENEIVKVIPFDTQNNTKLHMGTAYCNGRYWSPPRSDNAGYIDLMCFDGIKLSNYPINVKNKNVTRKYTDIIVKDKKLYSLPYGETEGMTEILEFDTDSNTYQLYDLDIPDFPKKYNVGVLIDDIIIAIPYGNENEYNSNWGLIFNTTTKEYKIFDIGINFGGKYRFRSGINHNGYAVFLPTGTPTCPILIIDKEGTIIKRETNNNLLLGRPIIHNNKIKTIAHNLITNENYIITID